MPVASSIAGIAACSVPSLALRARSKRDRSGMSRAWGKCVAWTPLDPADPLANEHDLLGLLAAVPRRSQPQHLSKASHGSREATQHLSPGVLR